MIRKGIFATAAAWAAFASMAVHAQSVTTATKTTCLTSEEADAALLTALPGAVRGLSGVCNPKLPADAYLKTTGATLAGRFQAAAKLVQPAADRAVARIAGVKTGDGIKDAAAFLDPMIELMVKGSADKLTPEICVKADQIFRLLDPLPARNFSGLLELIVELASKNDEKKDEKKDSPFKICERN